MGIRIDNGKLTVTASYGVTQNLGDYSSQKASSGLTLEFDVDGDEAAVIDTGAKLYDTLINSVKLAVLANLGLEADVDDNGVLQPKLGVPARPAVAAAAPAAAPATNGGGGYNGNGPQQYKPKADLSQCPRFNADLDGTGAIEWIDLRPVKASGAFSPKAADFRDASNAKHQVWLTDKGGNVKASVAQALQAAGVAV